MKVLKEVIDEAISRIDKRLFEISEMLSANPISSICEIRMEFKKLLDDNPTLIQRSSPEFTKKVGKMQREEAKHIKAWELMKNSDKLLEERHDLLKELRGIEYLLTQIGQHAK